jgi:nitrite reductase (NAD(P)H)
MHLPSVLSAGADHPPQRHAQLLASSVPPTKVVKILDRYIAYYIMTADKLQRTARWIENMEGGVEKLKKVILDDELGICVELESIIEKLVVGYVDEWGAVVNGWSPIIVLA